MNNVKVYMCVGDIYTVSGVTPSTDLSVPMAWQYIV